MSETTRSRRRRRNALSGKKGGSEPRGGAGIYLAQTPSSTIDRNILTNGRFTVDTSGWTATGSALASVAGGQSDNCLRITNSGAASGRASQQLQCPAGVYQLTLYYKNGTGTCKVNVGTTSGGSEITTQALTNVNWTQVTITFTAAGANPWISVFVNDATSGHTAFYDEIFVVPVK